MNVAAYPIALSSAQPELIAWMEQIKPICTQENEKAQRYKAAGKVQTCINQMLKQASLLPNDREMTHLAGWIREEDFKATERMISGIFRAVFRAKVRCTAPYYIVPAPQVLTGQDERTYSIPMAFQPLARIVRFEQRFLQFAIVVPSKEMTRLKSAYSLAPLLERMPSFQENKREAPNPCGNGMRQFEQVCQNHKECDLVFLLGEEKIKAHTAVLFHSDIGVYLQAHVQKNQLYIADSYATPARFRLFLKILYIENPFDLAACDLEDCLSIRQLAKKFEAKTLPSKVDPYLLQKISDSKLDWNEMASLFKNAELVQGLEDVLVPALIGKMNSSDISEKDYRLMIQVVKGFQRAPLLQAVIHISLQQPHLQPLFKTYLSRETSRDVLEIAETMKWKEVQLWVEQAMHYDEEWREGVEETRARMGGAEMQMQIEESVRKSYERSYRIKLREQLMPQVIDEIKKSCYSDAYLEVQKKIEEREGAHILERLRQELWRAYERDLREEANAIYEQQLRQDASIGDFVEIDADPPIPKEEKPSSWISYLTSSDTGNA